MQLWVIYALLSAVTAALVAIFGKIGISKVDSTLATTVRAIIMAFMLVIAATALGKWKLAGTIDRHALTFIVLSGVAGAASWFFYFLALRNHSAPGVAAVDRLSVVFVLVFAVLILGDHLTWKSGIGATLVAAGAILMALK
jgi:transporter family protein